MPTGLMSIAGNLLTQIALSASTFAAPATLTTPAIWEQPPIVLRAAPLFEFAELSPALALSAQASAPKHLEVPKPDTMSFVVFAGGAASGRAEVPRAADGMFYMDAFVNGVAVKFLVDTGSTSVVLTLRDALRAGIHAKLENAAQRAQTAGGSVAMERVKLARLVAGPTSGEDVDAAVTDSSLGVSLLGQSWLARFDSVTIRRDRMILE